MGANAAAIALHHAVHDLFEQDEGSLPEVQMDGVSPEEAQAMFDALLRIAAQRSLSSRMRRCRREISVQRPVRRRAC